MLQIRNMLVLNFVFILLWLSRLYVSEIKKVPNHRYFLSFLFAEKVLHMFLVVIVEVLVTQLVNLGSQVQS